jgi:uncharacterized protein
MIERFVKADILDSLTYFPVAGILGPRQVGKTTLAQQLQPHISRPCLYLDLESEEDMEKLKNPQPYLKSHQDKCVIIDEIQLLPRLFPLLRALIDQERVPARFMILGSASPSLIRQSSETLAGRIAYTELAPLSLSEISSTAITQEYHWYMGGFPDALLAKSELTGKKWLQNFLTTFLEKDLRALGYEISSLTLGRLYRMVAHFHGQILNVHTISQSLGVTNPTVSKYLDLVEGGFMIRRIAPYYVNLGKRLVKSPKIYFRDSGLLHQLSSIPTYEDLLGHPIVGASWEGYVIEQIHRAVLGNWQFYYYRTYSGAEVDLVVINPRGKMICIEIKYSITPSISKGFYQSVEDLKPHYQYVIIPSSNESYFLKDKLKVCSLSTFLKEELPMLS